MSDGNTKEGSGELRPIDPVISGVIMQMERSPFFEMSLDMLCIAGTDGYFKKVNPAFERTLGYPEAEFLARPFLDFVHPEDLEPTLREIEKLGAGMPTVMFENRYFAKDGGIRWMQWNASSPRADGLIFAVARDVTAGKRAEDDLRRYARELETSNLELKRIQEQLIQAEKMESVGRLAAGVAHEVKNPLGLLQLGVEYLTNHLSVDDDVVAKILVEMKRAIERASNIVNGLLDFSSEQRLKLEPVEFRPLVEEVLAMLRHELTRNKVRVELRIQRDLPRISGDSRRLQQVLINLLVNSIHAMADTAEPRIRIRARSVVLRGLDRDDGTRSLDHLREGDEAVEIDVIDNGTGIPAKSLPKVFDPFFTTKATGVGTGLGLTVVRSIVGSHRGQIEVRNCAATGGTQVTLRLKPSPSGRGEL